MCPFVRSGVGAASTQSWVNPYLALTALAELEKGAGAADALWTALADDEAGASRQFGLVDGGGASAAHYRHGMHVMGRTNPRDGCGGMKWTPELGPGIAEVKV
jgi:uncharacterized Ntn-hydrolase superfamily protein